MSEEGSLKSLGESGGQVTPHLEGIYPTTPQMKDSFSSFCPFPEIMHCQISIVMLSLYFGLNISCLFMAIASEFDVVYSGYSSVQLSFTGVLIP
jgi:hypothetical protein